MEKARDNLQKEIDIIRIIKRQRYIYMAIKSLLTADQRKLLKERGKFIAIDPDCETGVKRKKEQPKISNENDQSNSIIVEELSMVNFTAQNNQDESHYTI